MDFGALSKRSITSLKPTPNGYRLPKEYVIVIAGLGGSGKTSFLTTLYNCLNKKARDFTPFIIASGVFNHGTTKSAVLQIASNLIAIDTRGVVIPANTQFNNTKEAIKFLEAENSEVFKSLVDPMYLQKLAPGSFLSFPQLFLLVVKATVFLSKNRENSAEQIRDMTENVNQQILIKAWKDKLNSANSKMNNCVRIILTMADLCDNVNEIKSTAAARLGISENCIFMVTNFHPKVKDSTKQFAQEDKEEAPENIEENFFNIITNLFDVIDVNVDPIPNQELMIEYAIYCKAKDESFQKEVTSELRNFLGTKNRLHINPGSYHKIFGDPFPFYNKIVKVVYYHMGIRKEISRRENEALDLP